MPFGASLAIELAASLAADAAATADFVSAACSALIRGRSRGEVVVETGSGAIARTGPAWRSLEEQGGAPTAFQTYAFAQAVEQAHLARGETPRIVVIYDRDTPVVLLPTVITRWAGTSVVRFLGDPLIQYGDALVHGHAWPRDIEAAWQAAADPACARAAYLRKVRADSRLNLVLQRAAKTVHTEKAPFVAVSDNPSRSARDARELRRYRRRLQDVGTLTFDIAEGRDALPLLDEALALKQDWLAQRRLLSPVIGDPDWHDALRHPALGPTLRAARLGIGETTAAIEIAFVHNGCWHAFLGVSAPAFQRYGAGHVLTDEIVARCAHDGIRTYDLMAPADRYKRALTPDAVGVQDFAAAVTPLGQIPVLAAQWAPKIKPWLEGLPQPLRRLAVRLSLGRPEGTPAASRRSQADGQAEAR